jgi:hypothetical protein
MSRLLKLKRQVIEEANTRMLGEQTYDEIMADTRNSEDMTLIGPDGNEVKVKRTIIDGNEVIMYADTSIIDKNGNDEFKLTFGDNTYTGNFNPSEKYIAMDMPNSKYMITMFLDPMTGSDDESEELEY